MKKLKKPKKTFLSLSFIGFFLRRFFNTNSGYNALCIGVSIYKVLRISVFKNYLVLSFCFK